MKQLCFTIDSVKCFWSLCHCVPLWQCAWQIVSYIDRLWWFCAVRRRMISLTGRRTEIRVKELYRKGCKLMESHWTTNPLLSGYLGYSLVVLTPKSLMGPWLFYPHIVDADSVFTGRVNGSPQRTFLAQSRHELPTEEDGFAGRGDCWLFVHQHQWAVRVEERDLGSRVSTPLNDYNYFDFKLHNSVM